MEIPAEGFAEELIRAGRDKLRTLQLKRRLARYEVALAELQAAVDMAERGDPQPLQRWLAAADPQWVAGAAADQLPEVAAERLRSRLIADQTPISLGSDAEIRSGKATPASESVVDDRPAAPAAISGDRIRAERSEIGPAAGLQPKVGPTELSRVGGLSDRPPGSDRPEPAAADLPTADERPSSQRTTVGDPRRRRKAAARSPGQSSDSDVVRRTPQTVQLLAELPAGEAAPKPRGRWLAAAVSLMAHGLLLGWLLVVTLKHPSQPALQLQAARAPAAEVPIELMQELDWPESDLTFEADASPLPELQAAAEGVESQRLLERLAEGIGPAPDLLAGPPSLEAGGAGQSAELAGVQFFGAQAAGNNFVYVVDSSGSMRRGGAFDIARQELLRSIAGLKPHQRYYILFFHNEINALTLVGDQPESTMVYPTPENLLATQAWVQTIETGTGENPKRVLQRAFALDPDAIFLLTDGEFPDWVVTEFLPEANRIDDFVVGVEPKVPIHAIAFAANKSEDQLRMQRLAAENAGQYRLVPVEVPSRRSAGRQ
jgi:hypothetical protein